MADLIALNHGAKPSRHICTISSSSMMTWSIWGHRTAPWSSECSWWSTCPSVVYCLPPVRVGAYAQPCWLRKSSWDCSKLLSGLQHTACGMIPCWVIDVCWVGLCFVSSLNIGPITLSDKVLMHLVLPNCKVYPIELLRRKSTSHPSVLDVVFFSFAWAGFVDLRCDHNTV